MSDGPAMRFRFAVVLAGLFLMSSLCQAAAQDVRGLEICTAEKNMERRTGCLQANIDFLQQRLNRVALDAQQKQAAADRELAALKAGLAAAQAEIAALKEALAKLVKSGDAQKPAVDRK
jgi:hypothetical protein